VLNSVSKVQETYLDPEFYLIEFSCSEMILKVPEGLLYDVKRGSISRFVGEKSSTEGSFF
jgi:hypothetical protein